MQSTTHPVELRLCPRLSNEALVGVVVLAVDAIDLFHLGRLVEGRGGEGEGRKSQWL